MPPAARGGGLDGGIYSLSFICNLCRSVYSPNYNVARERAGEFGSVGIPATEEEGERSLQRRSEEAGEIRCCIVVVVQV